MARFPNFCGPSYTSRSVSADASRLVNMYVEMIEVQGDGTNTATLYQAPGITTWSTLPTAPIRGTWVGQDRFFAVAGSRFYEVFSDGAYHDRGDVGSGTGPAQIVPNGNQVMIVAGGNVYIDTGTAIIQPVYTAASGYVGTSGTSVQLGYGDTFDFSMVGGKILINGVLYTVASMEDPFHLTLVEDAGTQPNAPYSIPQAGTVVTNGKAVSKLSGDDFTLAMIGHPINIGGTTYTVDRVLDAQTLILTTDAGFHMDEALDYWAVTPVTASSGTFLDGYFIISVPYTKEFHISHQYDGTHWDPLDFGVKEGYPDAIAFLLADHEELYIFGTQTAEVWRNTGNADFPFERDLGAFIHLGNVAPYATSRFATAVAWLEGDPEGAVRAYRSQGYNPTRISTHAVENAWGQYGTISDAEGFVFVLDGHEFWQINFPTANATWVYDATTSTWHERQYSTGGRHRARTYGYVFGKHLVGDYANGKIYQMSNTLYTDDGVAMQCIRRCPHLSIEMQRKFHYLFRVEMEQATGLTATLSWSNQGGKSGTFNTPRNASGSVIANGDTSKVVAQEWRRLGSSRDRVYELTLTATSRIALTNADIEVL